MSRKGDEKFGEGDEELGLEGMQRLGAGAESGHLSTASLEGFFQLISQEFILRTLVRNIFKVLVLTEGDNKRIQVCCCSESQAVSKAAEM